MDKENVFRILTKKQPIIDGSPIFEKLEKEHQNYFYIGTYFQKHSWREQNSWSFAFE